jgi:hypothetical protein
LKVQWGDGSTTYEPEDHIQKTQAFESYCKGLSVSVVGSSENSRYNRKKIKKVDNFDDMTLSEFFFNSKSS